MTGFEDNTFRPNEPVTRAQLIQIIAEHLIDYPDAKMVNFENLIGHWVYWDMTELVKAGVIDPYEYNDTYNADLKITRQEFAKIISKTLTFHYPKWKDVLTGPEKTPVINLPFKDNNAIIQSEHQYFAFATGTGIMSESNGTFTSKGTVTRSELAVMLKHLLEVKDQTPVKATLLKKYTGKKPVHTYNKAEIQRLSNIMASHTQWKRRRNIHY